jgi:hypothetical protein
MNEYKPVALAPSGDGGIDSSPSQLLIEKYVALHRSQIVQVLHKFLCQEVAKLALATNLTLRDLLGPKDILRDTLWIELRYAMVEEPVALRVAFPGVASDPESHDNRTLLRKLKCLNPALAQPLAWVVVAVTMSKLLDGAIRGTISGHFCYKEIAGAFSAIGCEPGPSETVPLGPPVTGGANTNSRESVGSLVGGS